MPKLHEVLAVESGLKNQADKTRGELVNTFEKKRHLFAEKVVTFTPDEENAVAVTEEQLDLQSTVPKELAWIAGIWAKALDAAYQVAEGNMNARADVVLENGTTLLAGVPATALLELEKRANEIQDMVAKVPTLDPAKGFQPDPDRGKDVFRAREETKVRTKKVTKVLTLAPATKEHPAQAQLISVDDPIGKIQTREWSGLITPAQKADMLERVEEVRRAVKAARSRANGIEVDVAKYKVGAKIFDYVFGVVTK